jgi:cytochrome b involved in lipid metabolism
MKKLVIISLVVFWTVIVAILAAGLVVYELKKQSPQTSSGTPSALTQEQNKLKGLMLSAEELAKHNSSSSCWLLIENKVYDVTSFLNVHPGSAGTILPTCGTDATKDYNTKDRPEPKAHSANAHELLKAYYIGDLGQVVSGDQSAVSGQPQPTQQQNSGGQVDQPTSQNSGAPVLLSLQEISGHNKISDCWMIIENKVYNLTSYFNAHPGGVQNILNYCGKDGTAAYATKGGAGSPHSSNAHQLLVNFYVGDVGQNVSSAQTQPKIDPAQLPTGGDGEFEDD